MATTEYKQIGQTNVFVLRPEYEAYVEKEMNRWLTRRREKRKKKATEEFKKTVIAAAIATMPALIRRVPAGEQIDHKAIAAQAMALAGEMAISAVENKLF